MHCYEACHRICPVLGGCRTDTFADPAKYIYRNDQYYSMHSGRVSFILLLAEQDLKFTGIIKLEITLALSRPVCYNILCCESVHRTYYER